MVNMARRQRDHKAEYARRKARARELGYSSVREARSTRKRLGVTRRDPLPVKTVAESIITDHQQRDRESVEWSNRHSKVIESRFDESIPEIDKQVYHRAFVKRPRNQVKWRQSFHDWLVPRFYTEQEFDERYGSGQPN